MVSKPYWNIYYTITNETPLKLYCEAYTSIKNGYSNSYFLVLNTIKLFFKFSDIRKTQNVIHDGWLVREGGEIGLFITIIMFPYFLTSFGDFVEFLLSSVLTTKCNLKKG